MASELRLLLDCNLDPRHSQLPLVWSYVALFLDRGLANQAERIRIIWYGLPLISRYVLPSSHSVPVLLPIERKQSNLTVFDGHLIAPEMGILV
jgi:hypothetical protein